MIILIMITTVYFVFHVCQVLRALYLDIPIETSEYEGSTVVIPIVQKTKLRLRDDRFLFGLEPYNSKVKHRSADA